MKAEIYKEMWKAREKLPLPEKIKKDLFMDEDLLFLFKGKSPSHTYRTLESIYKFIENLWKEAEYRKTPIIREYTIEKVCIGGGCEKERLFLDIAGYYYITREEELLGLSKDKVDFSDYFDDVEQRYKKTFAEDFEPYMRETYFEGEDEREKIAKELQKRVFETLFKEAKAITFTLKRRTEKKVPFYWTGIWLSPIIIPMYTDTKEFGLSPELPYNSGLKKATFRIEVNPEEERMTIDIRNFSVEEDIIPFHYDFILKHYLDNMYMHIEALLQIPDEILIML